MASPKVTNPGKSGDKVTFTVNNINYISGAVTSAQLSTLTEAQARALIDSGQALPLQQTYLAQFPWTMPPK